MKRQVCAGCGREQKANEGMWMLCTECGRFQCPKCYGNPLEPAIPSPGCPACRGGGEGDERAFLLDYLSKKLQQAKPRGRGRKTNAGAVDAGR